MSKVKSKVMLLEVKIHSINNNIGLMKWGRWCEEKGLEYVYVRGIVGVDRLPFIPDKIFLSIPFTYYSKIVEKTINHYLSIFPNVSIIVGGVFPTLLPKWFDRFNNPFFDNGVRVSIHRGLCGEIEDLIPKYGIEVIEENPNHKDVKKLIHSRKSKLILYSSRGCVNKCGYCCIPKLEGEMKSFNSIKGYLEVGSSELGYENIEGVVLYDNNFTENPYFNNIVDELVEFGKPIDIHGLHTESFTDEKCKKLSQLSFVSQGKSTSTPYIRFGFDKMKYKDSLYNTIRLVDKYNLKCEIFLYCLFGYTDKPNDFWKRIQIVKSWSEEFNRYIFLFPQRFQPLTSLTLNDYVGKYWDDELLRGIRRLSTFLHGFISVSPNDNVYKWIGYNENEFIENVRKMGRSNKERLIKQG